LRYDTPVREHLEDRFFWIVLWAFVASVAFVIARSEAASTYVGNLPINVALFAIIGLLISLGRAIMDAVGKPDPTTLECTTTHRYTAIYRLSREQVALLFVLAAVMAGLGTAVLLLIIAWMFARQD
jgi:hypothetical protein